MTSSDSIGQTPPPAALLIAKAIRYAVIIIGIMIFAGHILPGSPPLWLAWATAAAGLPLAGIWAAAALVTSRKPSKPEGSHDKSVVPANAVAWSVALVLPPLCISQLPLPPLLLLAAGLPVLGYWSIGGIRQVIRCRTKSERAFYSGIATATIGMTVVAIAVLILTATEPKAYPCAVALSISLIAGMSAVIIGAVVMMGSNVADFGQTLRRGRNSRQQQGTPAPQDGYNPDQN